MSAPATMNFEAPAPPSAERTGDVRPFAPPMVEAPLASFGKIPFGFGPRFFVALLIGLLWVIPAWWSPRFVPAMFLWDGLVVLAFIADLVNLPRPGELRVFRSWEHAPSIATRSQVTVGVENLSRFAVRCTLTEIGRAHV